MEYVPISTSWIKKGLTLLLTASVAVLSVACQTTPTGSTGDASHSMARPKELPTQLSIALKPHGEHLFVHTDLDGNDAGLFMLDTGAALDAVGLGLAGRLKLPQVGNGTAMGIGGPEAFTYRQVKQLSIGDLELESQRLAAINLNRFAGHMGISVNGVIGFPSLQSVPFTIDYRTPALTVYQPESFVPPDDAVAQPMRVRGGLPMVLAKIDNGPSVWLIVDTGADQELTLPLAYLKYWPQCVSVPMSGAGQSAGVGGNVKNLRTWIKQIDLFGKTLKHMPVSFEQSPLTATPNGELVGRVGHRLLEHFRLTFDSRGGVIWAQWQPRDQSETARVAGQTRKSPTEPAALSLRVLPDPSPMH